MYPLKLIGFIVECKENICFFKGIKEVQIPWKFNIKPIQKIVLIKLNKKRIKKPATSIINERILKLTNDIT